MAAKFEIESPKTGEYRWVLRSQGRTLATGETYKRRGMAERAIETLRQAAPGATIDDQTTRRRGTATTTGRAARATGRAAAKSVAKAGRAVEKAEKAAASTARRTVKKTAEAVTAVTNEATGQKRGGRAKKTG